LTRPRSFRDADPRTLARRDPAQNTSTEQRKGVPARAG
jgi:hypothetical protein